MNLKDKFSFKLGEMYNEDDIGYDVIFHAELNNYNGKILYDITWQPVYDEIPHGTYAVEQAEDAIVEGYWVVLD